MEKIWFCACFRNHVGGDRRRNPAEKYPFASPDQNTHRPAEPAAPDRASRRRPKRPPHWCCSTRHLHLTAMAWLASFHRWPVKKISLSLRTVGCTAVSRRGGVAWSQDRQPARAGSTSDWDEISQVGAGDTATRPRTAPLDPPRPRHCRLIVARNSCMRLKVDANRYQGSWSTKNGRIHANFCHMRRGEQI